MAQRRMLEMDVFGLAPLMGNPLAVVLDAEGLDDTTLQRFAAWTNFSETTFVLPPTVAGADYRLRIFTPKAELPFAGHPSIGTAAALLEHGVLAADREQLVMQCGAGLLPLRVQRGVDGERQIMVRAPRAKLRTLDTIETELLCGTLGLASTGPAWAVDVGARWLIVDGGTQQAVMSLQPDFTAIAGLQSRHAEVGITVFGRTDPNCPDAYEVRSFAPADGINEDPVCGSGNASVAAVLLNTGELTAGAGYSVRQGRCCSRDGRVWVQTAEDGSIEIGGSARTLVRGQLSL